jgi:1,4-dihydroxy-2-naphthoate octaprenyltransferase
MMRQTPAYTVHDGLERLATYPFHILTWVGDDGYPVSVATVASIDPETGTAAFDPPAGLPDLAGREVSLTGSHIHPQPGYGYDERRHVTVWGRPEAGPNGQLVMEGAASWGWDEAEVPFFEYSERSVPRARRYFDALSRERGTPVRPRLSLPWLTLRSTRLPFLTASVIPVVIGIAIAASEGWFDPLVALLTVIGAAFIHLGLNVANDVFDTLAGADDVNVTPTQYSGGSRVIQYGLMSVRRMATISAVCYAIGIACGLVILALRPSAALLAIGIVGFIVSVGYTAPPLRLVYRGVGELAVAVGFGPLMLLGAYVAQTGGTLAWEPFVASVPIAIFVALILYVNEIPDRRSDARAGKMTLPVRLAEGTVIRIYGIAAAVAFAILVLGIVGGSLPVTAAMALLAVPIAYRVYQGLAPHYDDPYGLMAIMAANIRVHLVAGIALVLAYLAVIAAAALAPGADLFLG